MRIAVCGFIFAGIAACLVAPEPVGRDTGSVADTASVLDTGPAADAAETVDTGPAADGGGAVDTGPTSDGGGVALPDAGISPVADTGPVGDAGLPAGICGTRGGVQDCGAGAFCNFPMGSNCGRTDRGGQCMWIPTGCNRMYQPVCGCDGNNYDNPCIAYAAGVSVEHMGDCEAGCGIPDGRQCAQDEFCLDRGPSCGQTRPEGGTCEQITNACAEIYDPVCGCNDQTYGNLCELINAQVQLKAEGECQAPPPPPPVNDGACGSPRAPMMCAQTHFCDRPIGTCPERNESTGGTCQPRPQGCNRLFRPVCGCDNATHPNSCEANAAGTSVRYLGACR